MYCLQTDWDRQTDRQTDTHTHIQHLRAHSYLALTVSWSFFLPPNWFQNRVQRRTTLEKQVNSMKYTRIWISEKFAETLLVIACGPNFPLRLPFLAPVTQAILIIAVMYTTQLAVAKISLKKVPHDRHTIPVQCSTNWAVYRANWKLVIRPGAHGLVRDVVSSKLMVSWWGMQVNTLSGMWKTTYLN